jgi:NAD(P)-dependent dehydrogenase (short-subunit alcohol dehydrogenase family)
MPEHALVSGGASGIGLQVTRRLLARGLTVTVLDADAEALAALASELPPGAPAHGALVDVTDEQAVGDAFSEAARGGGPITRVVTCAGTPGARRSALDLDLGAWRRTVDVHLLGTLLCARAFARPLLAEHEPGAAPLDAALVTVGSIVGFRGWSEAADYGPAKAAVTALTGVLAVEWAAAGIRVNGVAPGYTRTPMVAGLERDGYDLTPVEARIPLGRLAEVEEIAAAVENLLLDATYVTGVMLPVDGGWTAVGR